VTKNLAEKISTAKIGRALRTNPDYLNRVFREANGMTVTEYIHRRRLTDAAGMLRDEDGTISEVADACGYASVGHFRRMFQRYHGVTPGAYRRLVARAYVNAR
jgi:AraC-like DNA-binding protein